MRMKLLVFITVALTSACGPSDDKASIHGVYVRDASAHCVVFYPYMAGPNVRMKHVNSELCK